MTNTLSKQQIDQISRLLVEARRCAQKLKASMTRREVEPRAEFEALVDAIPSLIEANEWLWQLVLGSSHEPSEVVLKPCEIVREPDDYTVQCYCGWSGKVSQLMSLPKFKHGCPVCSAEFKPFALKSSERQCVYSKNGQHDFNSMHQCVFCGDLESVLRTNV